MNFRTIAIVAHAQRLDGVFTPDCKRTGILYFSSESFRFTGTQFDYHYNSCIKSVHGHDVNTLRADVLTLRFEALSPPGSLQAMPCGANAFTPRFCFAVTDAATQQPERQLLI